MTRWREEWIDRNTDRWTYCWLRNRRALPLFNNVCWEPEGRFAMDFMQRKHPLVLNGKSLNSDNILLTLNWQYTGCPPKSRTLNFCYFDIRKYSILKISSDKTLSSEKNDTKIIEIGWVVLILWSFLDTWSFLIFSSFSDNGFSDFHTLLPGNPLIRANKTKRELMDSCTRRK